MSRSYKKHPVTKDNQRGGARFGKRRSVHRLRRVPIDVELPTRQRKFFTKYFSDMYEIHDFISYWSWEEALEWFEKICAEDALNIFFGRDRKQIRTVEEFHDWWVKTQLGK